MKNKGYVVGIFLLVFLLYGQSLRFGYVLDDEPTIVLNRFVQDGWAGIAPIFRSSYWAGFDEAEVGGTYRPVPLATFAIEKAVFGQKPKISHFFQVLFYAFLGILLWQYAQTLFPEKKSWVSALFLLFFLAHPVHTEVVANLKSRDELLATLFAVGSLVVAHRPYRNEWIRGLGVFLCLFLALLSKETPIVLLFILPLSLYFSDPKLPFSLFFKHHFSAILGVFLAITAFLILRWAVVGISPAELSPMNDWVAFQAQPQQFLTRLALLGNYAWLLFFPKNLSISYFYNDVPLADWTSPVLYLSVLFYGGLVYFIFKNFRNYDRRIGVFGGIFFLLSIGFFSNLLFSVGNAFAERFLFLPSLGMAILVAYGVGLWLEKESGFGLKISVLALVLLFFVGKTFTRTQAWANEALLYKTDLQNKPESAVLNAFVGNQFYEEYKQTRNSQALYEAQKHLEKSVKSYAEQGRTWSSLGQIYGILGQAEASLQAYERAYKLSPNNELVRLRLSQAYLEQKRPQEALDLVLNLQTTLYARYLYYQLALCYRALGRTKEAENALQEGLTKAGLNDQERQMYQKILQEIRTGK